MQVDKNKGYAKYRCLVGARQTGDFNAARKTVLNIIRKLPLIIVEINENQPSYMCILEKH